MKHIDWTRVSEPGTVRKVLGPSRARRLEELEVALIDAEELRSLTEAARRTFRQEERLAAAEKERDDLDRAIYGHNGWAYRLARAESDCAEDHVSWKLTERCADCNKLRAQDKEDLKSFRSRETMNFLRGLLEWLRAGAIDRSPQREDFVEGQSFARDVGKLAQRELDIVATAIERNFGRSRP